MLFDGPAIELGKVMNPQDLEYSPTLDHHGVMVPTSPYVIRCIMRLHTPEFSALVGFDVNDI